MQAEQLQPDDGRLLRLLPRLRPRPGRLPPLVVGGGRSADGPTSWDELLEGGARIKREQGVQLGIGMSNEIDSRMAARRP